jgi:hypothetical protein
LKRLKISQMEATEIYKKIKLKNFNSLIAYIEKQGNEFLITVIDEFSDFEGGIYIEFFADTQQEAEIKADTIINKIVNKY